MSPDFRTHVVGRNILPLLREQDRGEFEVFCYSNAVCPDAWTAIFLGHSQGWREIGSLDDDRAAELIRGDGIDVLVDLALHMAQGRLLMFARKPAAVQVTFAGYPGTTGLAAGVLPALERGSVTFGCLNNFCKINRRLLGLWARVLAGVGGSRMVMMAPAGSARRWVLEELAAGGVGAERIEFVGAMPRGEYLAQYRRIDLCLDTLPYNGHATSLDAMWMGVPVVTRVGETVVGRAGLSQLHQIGLTELAGEDDERFVKIATELAGDLPRLAEMRRTIRGRMLDSPLTDARRFARNIEEAYRVMAR